MHDRSQLVQARIRRLLHERVQPALYDDRRPLAVSAWEVPGEPVPFADARDKVYEPMTPGTPWGRPWGTVWLRVEGEVPPEWSGRVGTPEVLVDLGLSTEFPGFQAEGTVYTPDGVILKAVESRNQHVFAGAPGERIEFFVESAANPSIADFRFFQPTALGDPATAGTAPLYRLGSIQVALRVADVWELQQDLTTLSGLVAEIPFDQPLHGIVLRSLERAADALDPHAVAATATAARAELADVLALPAHASAHRIAAVGHAHIDSAWLWPVRETVRKVARTFSNVLALMDEDPDFVFAASSAQQYAWLQQHYPELFARVARRVAEGRFVPVGGMWVESDTNMPGGEALARQFIAGKRFFMEHLGVEPLEVWLPDSFGYSGALPQIVAAAGSRWFLTQKISWNETNRMPHHTFRWEGIDGTRVFTHFPPADTYNAELSAAELARAQRQYDERGEANSSLLPFGWGNGGGGPTREMLAAAHRAHDLEGSPRVTMTTPRQFFEAAEREYASPPVWRGELYLESHRGTYTTQAATKRGNRRSEHLLREAELWATLRAVRLGEPYPYETLEASWRTVLLQQFHDILPGSSIAWVHQEAERNYAEVAVALEEIIAESIAALTGAGDLELAANAGPFGRLGVPGLGIAVADAPDAPTWARTERGFEIESAAMRAVVDERGLLTSLVDRRANRETIPPDAPGNLLQLFRDTPTRWDAWDLDAEYTRVVEELTAVDTIELADEGRCLRLGRSFGSSTLSQELRIAEDADTLDVRTRVDWHETQKLLKLAFPLDLAAPQAASEIQFGHLYRPTHANTSWDAARFETVAHRWVHVGEPGFGVAVGNDATYGHDIRSEEFAGEPGTVVRLSLLRAPRYPDPAADQGVHEFGVAVRVGSGIPGAVELGYRLNLPLRRLLGGSPVEPAFWIDADAVVIEAVKLAEDRSGDVIVRLYEAHGTRVRTTVTPGFAWTSATRTDLLERPLANPTGGPDGVPLELRPFELVTLRFARA